MFDAETGRKGGLAAAARMTPAQREARSAKANAAKRAKLEKEEPFRADFIAKYRKKAAKKGTAPEVVEEELRTLGLVRRGRKVTATDSGAGLTPADLESYFEQVDKEWPELSTTARRQQAVFLLRVDQARRVNAAFNSRPARPPEPTS
ncbi:hypothetical protein QMG83_03410 [Salinibacterium sp. G-O1]|uniref:hypothetical protein n=1 Tax=Salinibacterium sp. G-O1 TaxID=3046208 RepID=UPI0024BB8C65|nr:hypothetical protein [Salinibacterium sp. G-O1]MDJ0334267.1 hypothetical protein [Salinibacterium sp. G-O1]